MAGAARDKSGRRDLSPRPHRVARHLAAVGLPTRLSDVGMAGLGHRLTEHMMHDKKMEAGQISFVLARGIGQAFLAKPDLAEVRQFLDEAA